MDLDRLAGWLRCPICGEDLRAVHPLVLRCDRGHAVDVNRRGYASLLSPGTRVVGDSADMLAARDRFLAAGHYAPLVDELAAALRLEAPSDVPSPGDGGMRVLDAGCGTGHYLHAVLDRSDGATGLAADLSPRAVALAVRGRHDVDGVVADTWTDLPLRDGVADLVLDVFAPRNLPEFHRVLAPGGRVAVVAAGPHHLRELRADGRALGIQPDKRERILDAADGLFDHEQERRVRRVLQLTEEDVRLLIGMGPSAHHPPHAADDTAVVGAHDDVHDAVPSPLAVTLDVMIHVLGRRELPRGLDTRAVPHLPRA